MISGLDYEHTKLKGTQMAERNSGKSFISLFGLSGVLILVAGIFVCLGSRGDIAFLGLGGIAIVIGGAIVFQVLKTQRK